MYLRYFLYKLRRNKPSIYRVLPLIGMVLLVIGLQSSFWSPVVGAASIGPRTATASGDCISTTGIGSIAWTNPGNAFSDNATSATAGLGRNVTSNWIKCTNFGFTSGMFASGSTIDGFVVSVKRSVSTSNATTTDAGMRLVKAGTIGTTDRSTTTAWSTTLTSEGHGGTADLWGDTWTVSDVTASNFGAAFAAKHGGTTNSTFTYSVDVIQITIYYTPPPWTSITQRQGVITNDQNNTVLSSHTAKIGERLRVVTQVDTNTGSSKRMVLKLQYDKNDNSWSDVRPNGEIRPARSQIIGLSSITGAGKAGSCTSGVDVKRGWQYQNTNHTDSIDVQANACHEISFVVDTANASANTTYRFRLYNVLGATTLNTYSAYPSFSTVTTSNNTTRASKSNTTGLASGPTDLKGFLDNAGYSNISADDSIRESLQNVTGDTVADVTMTGGATGDTLGNTTASAGDVNGDGYDDVIVGAPGYSSSTGRAYIYFGGVNMDSVADVTITGGATGDHLGVSVSKLGDINDDGYDDVIVGADGYSSNTGQAYVYFGGANMDNTADLTMTGAGTDNYFGQSVSKAGDVNGDNNPDFVVGAAITSTNTAMAYIYHGGIAVDSTADVTLSAAVASSPFKIIVTGGGDINGDGYDDISVGTNIISNRNGIIGTYAGGASMDTTVDFSRAASDYDIQALINDIDINGDGYDDLFVSYYNFGTARGRVLAYLGTTTFDTTLDFQMDGVASFTGFGKSFANAGDVNGDGFEDILIGADGYDVGSGTNEGGAYIYYGGTSPDTTADVTIAGLNAGDALGTSVANAGDVNGDGFDDIIVGADNYSSGTGRAYIYYQTYAMDNTAEATMTGPGASNFFGSSVSSAGDVNGDGYEDIIVGSSGYSTNTGRAYIYLGGLAMDYVADITLTGGATNDNFGISVASAGDMNGDGYDDVIVGAYGYSSSTGRAYIFYGGASMDSTADITMTGGATNNYLGRSVASAGDVNGDGYDDVIVGAYGYSSSTGRAYIFYGGSSMDNTADVTMTGGGTSNNFGTSVASAGDVNGDGYDDVIIGAHGYSSYTGLTYIYYGGASMDNTADITMTGGGTGHYFGQSVASAGDVNGDGYSDVIVGATGYSSYTGRAYIYYGGASMDNTADITLTGEAANNYFGVSVASAGDINGDGYSDVIVGATGYSSYTGRAYIYYGGASMDNTADITMTGEASGNYFGISARPLRDMSGDGYSDVIVGAQSYSSDTGRSYVYNGGGSAYTPTFNYAKKYASACSGLTQIDSTWNGQSTVAASTKNIVLQAYRFGSTNAWTTVTTNSSLSADTDGNITGTISTNLSEYCDGSNWSYWRVYQDSGIQTLQSDEFALTFTASNQAPNSPSSLAQVKVTSGTTIATGGWTNENQVKMTATVSDPDASDTLQLCVERQLIGVSFTNTETSCGTGVSYSGSPLAAEVTLTGLSEGEYHWQVRVKDAGGLYSAWVSYGGNAESARDFGSDTSAPTGTVYDGSSTGVDASLNSGSLTSLSANWTSTTTISGLSGYEYSIGTTAGGTDILGWTSAGTSTSVTNNSLSLATSQIYYVNVRITDNAGNTAVISSNGITVAPTLTFSSSSNTVNFSALNPSNSYTASQTLTLTTTTNAKNGYKVYGKATGLLMNQSSNTIPMFNGGTYASPAAWGSSTGFGYNSSDTSVGGLNRFNSPTCLGGGAAPCFAPYSTTGIGDIVADATNTPSGGPALNDTTTITNKVSVSSTAQQSGKYQTTILYSAYATY